MPPRRKDAFIYSEHEEPVVAVAKVSEDVLMTNSIVYFQPMFTTSTLCSPQEMASRVQSAVPDLIKQDSLSCVKDVSISGYKISDFIYPSPNQFLPDSLFTYQSCFLDPYSHDQERQHKNYAEHVDALVPPSLSNCGSNSGRVIPSNVGSNGLRMSSCSSWYNVHMVELFCSSDTCQICLDPCCAPIITKCGHFFCLSCFLHYLSTCSERRCPMCFKQFSCIDDLRLCMIRSRQFFKQGDICDLEIVVRRRGSTYPFKTNTFDVLNVNNDNDASKLTHFGSSVDMTKYKRYCTAVDLRPVFEEHKNMLTSKIYVRRKEMGQIDEEEEAIFSKKKGKGKTANSWITPLITRKPVIDPSFDEELQFYLMALKYLDDWLATYLATPIQKWQIEYEAALKNRWKLRDSIVSTPSAPRPTYHANNNVFMQDYVYSFQCTDGAPVFLHPFLFRCMQNLASEVLKDGKSELSGLYVDAWHKYLKKHGKCVVPLPNKISLPIIHLEHITVNSETKKKYAFLAHFPMYTEATFVVCDITAVLPSKFSSNEHYKLAEKYVLQTYQKIADKEARDALDRSKRENELNEDILRQMRLYNDDTAVRQEREVLNLVKQEHWEHRHQSKAKNRKTFQEGFLFDNAEPQRIEPAVPTTAATKWSNLAKSGHKHNYFDGKDPFSSM